MNSTHPSSKPDFICQGAPANPDTLESLTEEYQRWLANESLPQVSADDLLLQSGPRNLRLGKRHISYLRTFIERWLTVADAGHLNF